MVSIQELFLLLGQKEVRIFELERDLQQLTQKIEDSKAKVDPISKEKKNAEL